MIAQVGDTLIERSEKFGDDSEVATDGDKEVSKTEEDTEQRTEDE